MAEISVIVPVYAVESWLRQCVQSILDQSFRDIQLILVEDGSPDRCGEICDYYARRDPRVTVLHRENGGVSTARNAGLALASGRYVTFCDGDDFWEESHLETLHRAAVETGAELVSCNYAAVDEMGNFLRETCYPAGLWTLDTEAARVEYILGNVLQRKTVWAVWCRLFDRKLIREKGIRFPEGCDYGEDLAFLLQCLLHGRRLCAIPAATCRYRVRRGSAMDTARHQTRIPQLNAAAQPVFGCWNETLESEKLRRLFPLVHYGILREEYEKLPAAALPQILDALPERDWFLSQVRRVPGLKRELRRYFGKATGHALAVCHFCLHRRVNLYRLERYLARRYYDGD